MAYREELPAQCPPDAAEEITVEREVFRVVKSDPPTDGDFRSQRALRPRAVFQGVPECLARGLSVFGERGDGEKALKSSGLRGGMLTVLPTQEPMPPTTICRIQPPPSAESRGGCRQKKTPRVLRPKGFLRANPCGSAHRRGGEKLMKTRLSCTNVNTIIESE